PRTATGRDSPSVATAPGPPHSARSERFRQTQRPPGAPGHRWSSRPGCWRRWPSTTRFADASVPGRPAAPARLPSCPATGLRTERRSAPAPPGPIPEERPTPSSGPPPSTPGTGLGHHRAPSPTDDGAPGLHTVPALDQAPALHEVPALRRLDPPYNARV